MKTLLLVDDDKGFVELLSDLFSEDGFNTLIATSGNMALEVFKIHKDQIDLILSDVRMPDGDGIVLLRGVRSISPETPPFLFYTGYSEISSQDAMSFGANGIIQKPVDYPRLLAKVNSFLGPR